MSQISLLQLHHFRNLSAVKIIPASQFNFLIGQNGAGKTSLLESIYYLGVGRSFRTHITQRLIQDNFDNFSIFMSIHELTQTTPLGVERYNDGRRRLKIDGNIVPSWSHIAKRIPLCILSAMSHRFLHDGPKTRRQFLDWLLFHVEQSFYESWQRVQRSLKQRNAALKAQLPKEQVVYWDETLIQAAELIDKLRNKIVIEFAAIFNNVLSHFLPDYLLQLNYHRGWSESQSLAHEFQNNFQRDAQIGYTQVGPHRADLRLLVQNLPAQDILSQGQQKLVTYALYLAQGLLLKQKTGINPIYLIDDLAAELDQDKCGSVLKLLAELDAQVFITGTSSQDLDIRFLANPDNSTMFHVEHGSVQALSNGVFTI